MIPRERKYSMSQIHLVGESVFMTPGLRAKYDPKANLLWLIDQWIFPHNFSQGHLETLPAIRCQLVCTTPSPRNGLPSHTNSMLCLHKSQVAGRDSAPLLYPPSPLTPDKSSPVSIAFRVRGGSVCYGMNEGFTGRQSLFQTHFCPLPNLRELGQVPPPLWGYVYLVVKWQ